MAAAWRLVEISGGAERRVCTSDYVETLERIGAMLRRAEPTLTHRVEPNVADHKPEPEPKTVE